MKILPILFILVGCTTQNIPAPVYITKHDTVIVHKRDTVRLVYRDTLLKALVQDTTQSVITLGPDGSDSYPELQAAINYCKTHPGKKIALTPGNFYLSHPLIIANRQGSDYGQVTINIEGATNAKNAPSAFTSNIIPLFDKGFCIGIQQGKGCSIKNLSFAGQYTFPNGLNTIQIDSLKVGEWPENGTRTSPYAAIVIDPFSDPTGWAPPYGMYSGMEAYYLVGMSRSGSTAINIEGCGINNFTVGVMITPSFQSNGDLINLTDSRIDYCKVAYAYSQAQSKTNLIYDLMCWGHTHTVVDGMHYGFPRGDGSVCPMIDVMNIAGGVHELFQVEAPSFPATIKRVYAESIFKIGILAGSDAGISMQDCQIDFDNGHPGVPSPDYYVRGGKVAWSNCMLRIYNGSPANTRIVFNMPLSTFSGGTMSCPPITANEYSMPPIFSHTSMYYTLPTEIDGVQKDSVYNIRSGQIHVNKSHYTGYFIGSVGIKVGDLMLYQGINQDEYVYNYQTPLGFVTAINGDTVKLQNIGVGVNDGLITQVWVGR